MRYNAAYRPPRPIASPSTHTERVLTLLPTAPFRVERPPEGVADDIEIEKKGLPHGCQVFLPPAA